MAYGTTPMARAAVCRPGAARERRAHARRPHGVLAFGRPVRTPPRVGAASSDLVTGPASIFAESEKDYFLKVVDAQLTFETDAQNKAVAVVLHQNVIDQRARRIEGEPVAPTVVMLESATRSSWHS